MKSLNSYLLFGLLAFSLLGCQEKPPVALGTLEWDRVNSRAVQSEVIVEVFTEEGSPVTQGAPIIQLDDKKQLALKNRLEAELTQAIWQEKELMTGPRPEEIAEAKARLAAAEANVGNTKKIFRRQQSLRGGDYTSQELFDNSENNYKNALAQKEVQRQILKKLEAGTRVEQLQQAQARVKSAEAGLKSAQLQLDEYLIRAPRSGRVDSLPYKVGDRPPTLAVVSTILSGDRPWARVYIPEPWRSRMKIGEVYQLQMDGQKRTFSARLRSLEARPSFTPYFALTEKDRSYLCYVAQLDLLESEATQLSAGTPVELILEQP